MCQMHRRTDKQKCIIGIVTVTGHKYQMALLIQLVMLTMCALWIFLYYYYYYYYLHQGGYVFAFVCYHDRSIKLWTNSDDHDAELGIFKAHW